MILDEMIPTIDDLRWAGRCCRMEMNRRAAWGKWVFLLIVVALLALWFALSSGTENYRDKYAGEDLDALTVEIGRRDTYAAYL